MAPPPSSSSQGVPPFSFDDVGAAIWTYRIALLNFENSSSEEKEPNGKALDKSVETLQKIFDSYSRLTELTRQLVGVFLKELYFESKPILKATSDDTDDDSVNCTGTKGKHVAEGSQTAEARGSSCSTSSRNDNVGGIDNGE